MLTVFMIIGILIILIVLVLSVLTTSKAYTYKHKVDALENNPNISDDDVLKNVDKKVD